MMKRSPKNLTYAKVYNVALELFRFDKDKTNTFWMTKNEMLNGLSPFEMVKEGRGRELLKIINRCV